MATLVLGAIGSLIGGPIGGALGGLLGQQVDREIFGSPKREGPRLNELKLTTSSYGTPIARHHGQMRGAGTIIWATDLEESSESAGGKGQPTVTSYSYTVSFAVALASRPIKDVGRIWADGNLLRGEAGDLKVGGAMRLYRGYGDHARDPLIASDKGADCPGFRQIAYAVFEDLQLADYGNRIPGLSFEIVADDGSVSLSHILAPLSQAVDPQRDLDDLQGFSLDGGPIADALATIDSVYPLGFDAGSDRLSIADASFVPEDPPVLPEAVQAKDGQSFGGLRGESRHRSSDERSVPDILRYYDVERDFQAGLQRADGRARPGRSQSIEFPGALNATTARGLVNDAAERAGWSREVLSWRIAELDPGLKPGSVVRVPGHAGNWRIAAWEWRDQGIELELLRLPRGPARRPVADAGTVLSPPDLVPAPTLLEAFELPWDGIGAGDTPAIYAAPSSQSNGWSGAALYADRGGELIPLGGSGSTRSIIGQTTAAVSVSRSLVIDRQATIEVQLASDDFALVSTSSDGLATGANRALLGGEVVQFLEAEPLGGGNWRLSGLLRGRGGTEAKAALGHSSGARFVLLDGKQVALDAAKIVNSSGTSITAIGIGDISPVSDAIANPGLTLRPLAPVHASERTLADGSLKLSWIRRGRGAWRWEDEVEIPLAEQQEAYRVGLGSSQSPHLFWEVTEQTLILDSATVSSIASEYSGENIWVRQIGTFSQSEPLLLTTLP